jgi:hypothetical protein
MLFVFILIIIARYWPGKAPEWAEDQDGMSRDIFITVKEEWGE